MHTPDKRADEIREMSHKMHIRVARFGVINFVFMVSIALVTIHYSDWPWWGIVLFCIALSLFGYLQEYLGKQAGASTILDAMFEKD